MSWSFDIPGQPPTTNHLYVRVRGKWNMMTKAPGVAAYQDSVVLLARQARPSGWQPGAQLRVTLALYLKRDVDADNCLKSILDALALALGCNDRIMLPCITHKSSGHPQPHTTVTVE